VTLTVSRAIPLTLVAAAGLFGLSGVHRFENAHHGTDAVIGQAAWLGFLIAALATIVLVAVALYRRRKLRHSGVFLAALLALGLAAMAAASTSLQGASVTLTNRGPVLHGPTSWRPGHVRIAATSRLADQEVTLLRFRPGYSYADFLADGRKAQRHDAAGRAAVADVFAHTIFAGGIDLFRDQSATMTVNVKAGTYYLGEMTTRPQLTPIHVAGAPSNATLHSAATITATDDGYRVSGLLPANGTITVANASSRPHRVNLIPIEPGTTRTQVLAYIRTTGGGENAPPPPFALDGPQIGTADLSPGQRMQLTYELRAGTYAAVDFDRDVRTGRPEALEGLVTVVTLH